jgi:hypothetical protein
MSNDGRTDEEDGRMEEQTTAKNEMTDDCHCGEGKVPDRQGKCVMPEVTFPAFVLSLNTSVLYHLGEIGDPATGKRAQDFDLARHGIDTLVLLEQKTKGNLEKDEEELLKNIIYDVKLRFVKAVKK